MERSGGQEARQHEESARGTDLTQLRRNLRLTPDERLRKMVQLYSSLTAMRGRLKSAG